MPPHAITSTYTRLLAPTRPHLTHEIELQRMETAQLGLGSPVLIRVPKRANACKLLEDAYKEFEREWVSCADCCKKLHGTRA